MEPVNTGNRLDRGSVALERGWKQMAVTSVASLSLWLAIILAGAFLVSVG